MKKALRVIGYVALLSVLVAVLVLSQRARDRLVNAQEIAVLNPSFEGTYIEWSQRINLAPDWRLVYWKGKSLVGGGSVSDCAEPECKPILASQYPYRVRSGEKAQSCFWFYNHGDAALYTTQQVPAGTWQVGSYAHCWVSDIDTNPTSCPGEMYISIGVDPEGRSPGQGGWPWETSVSWSPFVRATARYERYMSRVFYVPATTDVTVYVRFWKKWDQKHGDVYVDDVFFNRIADAGGPTQTPYPTYTAQPTYTPYPTFTPQPTAGPTTEPLPTTVPGEWEHGEQYIETFGIVKWFLSPWGDRCYDSIDLGEFACVK